MNIHEHITAVLGSALVSCTDGNDWGIDSAYDRLFGVNAEKISVTAEDLTAEVTFNTVKDAEYYIIEVSTDSLYDDVAMGGANAKVFGANKEITKSPYTLEQLVGDTRYYLRMKSMADGKNDQIEYFDIEVDDQLVDNQVNMYASRAGHYNDKVETFDATKNDLLSGDLRELDSEGNSLEGGIVVDSASIMPQYFKGDEQKTLFENAKVGDIITFNPSKAYTGNDAEVASLLKIDKANVAEHAGDFSYQITKISRYENAEINKELFDSAFGKDANIETEEQFREKIKKELSVQLEQNSDFAFLKSVRTYCEQKAGEVVFPEAILKRIMLDNNKDKGEDYVENNFEQSIKELEWHLIREKLAQANGVKVEEADIKAAARDYARMQFAQYGMSNVPDDTLDSYAAEMLKKYETVEAMSERVIDKKLTDALKSVVKLDRKSISLDDFNKKMEA